MQKGQEIEPEQERIPVRKALIISVSDYSSSLQSLIFCKNDGKEMCGLLKSIGYKVVDNHQLIGHVTYDKMRDAIYDFFENTNTKAEDTLVFYYSGHGIPDVDGDIYLASSEIDPDFPYKKGFSFNDLTKMIQRSVSIRIVTILDCCYSGAAKLSKGHEEDAAKMGTASIDNKANVLQQGEGKCLLAASQAAQEAYALKEGDHSIFTYYLLEGLKGTEKSVDYDGNITPYSLGNYVYRAILNLPARKRPKQKPITKVEASGDIILASYPNLARSKFSSSPVAATNDLRSSSIIGGENKKEQYYNPQSAGKEEVSKKQQRLLVTNTKILIPIVVAIVGIAIVVFFVIGSGMIHQQQNQPSNTITSPPVVNPPSNKVLPTPSAPPVAKVSIVYNAGQENSSKSYDPSPLYINRNTNATWINNDSTLHTVTSGSPFKKSNQEKVGQIFDSGMISPHGSFSYIFDKAGRYDYYCILHPFTMSGSIIVK